MFTIRNKPLSPRMLWDKDENKPLLTFEGGLFVTPDKKIADKAKKLGYEVEAPEEPEEKPKAKSKK